VKPGKYNILHSLDGTIDQFAFAVFINSHTGAIANRWFYSISAWHLQCWATQYRSVMAGISSVYNPHLLVPWRGQQYVTLSNIKPSYRLCEYIGVNVLKKDSLLSRAQCRRYVMMVGSRLLDPTIMWDPVFWALHDTAFSSDHKVHNCSQPQFNIS